jgi:hypothetical protein
MPHDIHAEPLSSSHALTQSVWTNCVSPNTTRTKPADRWWPEDTPVHFAARERKFLATAGDFRRRGMNAVTWIKWEIRYPVAGGFPIGIHPRFDKLSPARVERFAFAAQIGNERSESDNISLLGTPRDAISTV